MLTSLDSYNLGVSLFAAVKLVRRARLSQAAEQAQVRACSSQLHRPQCVGMTEYINIVVQARSGRPLVDVRVKVTVCLI